MSIAVVTQETGQVARPKRSIKDLLQGPELKAAIAAAIPKHLTAERFIRTALTATMRTPKLLECTPESLFQCLLDLSAYGLEPDGRRAHLIPYGNKCTLILDYKGLVELVRRSGDVSYIHADVVYAGDEWSFAFGSKAHLTHSPNMARSGDEKAIAYYSFVKLKDGSEDFMVMSPMQVEKIRKRSKSGTSGPWVTDYDEMGKKTAFRNHSKWLPLSSEVRSAIEHDDDAVDIVTTKAAADSIHASISLEDVTASQDPNRGHNGTQATPAPEEVAKAASGLKHLGSKGVIPIYNQLPDVATVTNGQKVYVRDFEGDELFVFDEELGKFIIIVE
jgi:recombination protein RecT